MDETDDEELDETDETELDEEDFNSMTNLMKHLLTNSRPFQCIRLDNMVEAGSGKYASTEHTQEPSTKSWRQ